MVSTTESTTMNNNSSNPNKKSTWVEEIFVPSANFMVNTNKPTHTQMAKLGPFKQKYVVPSMKHNSGIQYGTAEAVAVNTIRGRGYNQ